MVVGRINGVVGLTEFSDKKLTGRLVGGRKAGFHCIKIVASMYSI